VFEFQHESLGGAQNALGGGGRYDGLAAALGYRPTPGIGFALGMDRTAMVMQEAKRLAQNVPDVWAIAVDTPDSLHVLHLAENLRAQGHSVVMDPSHGRLDAKLRRAAKRGARVVIMVGPDERDKDEVVVRNMVAQTQVSVPQRDLVATVSSALGPA
jgi:histidyl-tRNA synthetase